MIGSALSQSASVFSCSYSSVVIIICNYQGHVFVYFVHIETLKSFYTVMNLLVTQR